MLYEIVNCSPALDGLVVDVCDGERLAPLGSKLRRVKSVKSELSITRRKFSVPVDGVWIDASKLVEHVPDERDLGDQETTNPFGDFLGSTEVKGDGGRVVRNRYENVTHVVCESSAEECMLNKYFWSEVSAGEVDECVTSFALAEVAMEELVDNLSSIDGGKL